MEVVSGRARVRGRRTTDEATSSVGRSYARVVEEWIRGAERERRHSYRILGRDIDRVSALECRARPTGFTYQPWHTLRWIEPFLHLFPSTFLAPVC